MSLAGIDALEHMCPTTPNIFPSAANFCATAVPPSPEHCESSTTNSTLCPLISGLSSTASCAAFCMSIPRFATSPLSPAANPIFTASPGASSTTPHGSSTVAISPPLCSVVSPPACDSSVAAGCSSPPPPPQAAISIARSTNKSASCLRICPPPFAVD